MSPKIGRRDFNAAYRERVGGASAMRDLQQRVRDIERAPVHVRLPPPPTKRKAITAPTPGAPGFSLFFLGDDGFDMRLYKDGVVVGDPIAPSGQAEWLFAGPGGEFAAVNDDTGNLMVSLDGGLTWTEKVAPATILNFTRSDNGDYWAWMSGTDLYLSTDQGDNWTLMASGDPLGQPAGVFASGIKVTAFYTDATINLKALTSIDEGATFTSPIDLGADSVRFQGQGAFLDSGRIVAVFVAQGADEVRSSTSDDDGGTWATPAVIGTTTGTIRPMVIGSGSGVIAIAHENILRSDDEGDSWNDVANPTGRAAYDIAYNPATGVLITLLSSGGGDFGPYQIWDLAAAFTVTLGSEVWTQDTSFPGTADPFDSYELVLAPA